MAVMCKMPGDEEGTNPTPAAQGGAVYRGRPVLSAIVRKRSTTPPRLYTIVGMGRGASSRSGLSPPSVDAASMGAWSQDTLPSSARGNRVAPCDSLETEPQQVDIAGQEQRAQVLILYAVENEAERRAGGDACCERRSRSCFPFMSRRQVAPAGGDDDSGNQTKGKPMYTPERRVANILGEGSKLLVHVACDSAQVVDKSEQAAAAGDGVRFAVVLVKGKLSASSHANKELEELRRGGWIILPVLLQGAEGTHTWKHPFRNSELLGVKDLRGSAFRKEAAKLRESLISASSVSWGEPTGEPSRPPQAMSVADVDARIRQAFKKADVLGSNTIDADVLVSHLQQRSISVTREDIDSLVKLSQESNPDAGELDFVDFRNQTLQRMGLLPRDAGG